MSRVNISLKVVSPQFLLVFTACEEVLVRAKALLSVDLLGVQCEANFSE